MSAEEESSTLFSAAVLEQDRWSFSEWTSAPVVAEVIDQDGLECYESGSCSSESSQSVHLSSGNAYVKKLLQSADLHILQPGRVCAAYDSEARELNLFHLFFSKTFLEAVGEWTNEVLVSKGKKSVSMKEFYAYMGLEMGMSLVKYNALKSYWSNGKFLGHEMFKETMSQNRFMEVRSCVRFVSMQSYDGQTANDDPLWFCRSVLDEFIRQSGRVAVPIGISALDENTCPTKARTRAKTYCPNKPAKYGIRFYAVVGHKYCYLSTMYDNRAGNRTGVQGVHDYHRLFRNLRTPYYMHIGNDTSKDTIADTPSALWICMMGQQTKNFKQPGEGKRYFFTDNFYTRHIVAERLQKFTDNEAYLIGTLKFTNVDATNRYHLSRAMETLKDAPRGTWCLVQAYNKNPNYERLRNQHRQQRHSAPFVIG